MTDNARKLYEEFKKEYIESGYLYSGCIGYKIDEKEAFEELQNLGIIKKRNCEAYCFELSEIERKRLLIDMNLEKEWRKEHGCFLHNGKFQEVEELADIKIND